MLNLTMPILMNEHTKDNLQIRKDDERREFEAAHPLYHDRFIILPFMSKMKWGDMNLTLTTETGDFWWGQPLLRCNDCNENNGKQGFFIITPYASYYLAGYRYESVRSIWNNKVPLLRYWNRDAKYIVYNLHTVGYPYYTEPDQWTMKINSSDNLTQSRWRDMIYAVKQNNKNPQFQTLNYIFNGRNPGLARAWKYRASWSGSNNFCAMYCERITW